MSSLVSDFLINPVARTVRRFSYAAGATDSTGDNTETVRRPLAQDFTLDHGEVIAERNECDGPSRSFPSLSFMRGPDIALGARSPPLLIPQHRRRLLQQQHQQQQAHLRPQAADDYENSRPFTTRSPSPSFFEMEAPTIPQTNSLASPVAPQDAPSQDQMRQDQPQQEVSRRLPENDGMADMRRRILSIQTNDLFLPDQKRYLMQQVLTESYAMARHAKAVADGKVEARTLPPFSGYASASQDPSTPGAQDLGFGIAALETLRAWTGLDEEEPPIHVSEGDREVSYRIRVHVRNSDRDNDGDGEEEHEIVTELGCSHYKRNVKVQCAACEKWYPCRLCHDEVEEHVLPRKLTKHMLCMLCSHPQKASDTCIKCNESAASYYCSICKLWSDDVDKHIYHCDECGICRVGHGLEKDFFHCKTCRACISIATREDHKCIERATDADCPICGDNMFDSPLSVIFMECGHPIHKGCFDQYMNTSYKCPLCNKSIVKMDALFLNLANIIKEQPMPEAWQDMRSVVLCNDCSAKTSTQYHFLGLRCQNCQSYNTVELQRSPMPGFDVEAGSEQHTVQGEAVALSSPHHPEPSTQPGDDDETYSDGEDDDGETDLWGRDPRHELFEEDGESDEDDEDEDEDEDEEEEESESDDDEHDGDIVLLGHR